MSTEQMNRTQRRIFAQPRHVKGTGRAGRRTGQPEWFVRMKWDAQRRKYLKSLPTTELVKHGVCTAKQANNLQEAGFATVWDVVDAKYGALLKVPTFGPKTLAKLKQDAKIKVQLDMNWAVSDGR